MTGKFLIYNLLIQSKIPNSYFFVYLYKTFGAILHLTQVLWTDNLLEE